MRYGSDMLWILRGLFMGLFESRYIYPRIDNKHRLYTRFKDDIFLIWTDGEASLLKFFKEINTCHPSIKFECHHSRSIVNYLDTNIHLDRSGNLKTSLFSKLTRTSTTTLIIPQSK